MLSCKLMPLSEIFKNVSFMFVITHVVFVVFASVYKFDVFKYYFICCNIFFINFQNYCT